MTASTTIPVSTEEPGKPNILRPTLIGLTTALTTFSLTGWVGLHVQPPPFPAISAVSTLTETIPLPVGLPKPVERLYRVTYGERVPVIRTAVLSGRGTMRLNGVTFPARFRFIHEAAHNFRAYFEITVFGQPIMKVNEHYVGGKFRQELPFGVEEGEPKIDHSANIRMWGEWVSWLPAMLLTDPQVHWEPLDNDTAVLVVPFGEEQEHLVVRFDPATGKVQYFEGMKYKYATDTTKTLWVNAVWFGETPWATFNIEDVVYNVLVDTSLTAKGP
jgi:hypothetical protein